MSSFNLFVKEVPTNEWTVTGTTALEVLGRESTEPTNPAVAKKVEASTAGLKFIVSLKIPAELETVLEEGGKLTAFSLRFNGKAATGAKRLKTSTNAPVASNELELASAQGWFAALTLSKAQAEEINSLAKLEELRVTCEHLTAGLVTGYEVYATVEAESGGGTVVKPKVEIAFKNPNAIKALQTQATGPTSRLTWGFQATPIVTTLAGFQSRFKLNESATAQLLQAASPTSRLVLGENLTARQAQAAVPSMKLVWGFHATAKVKGEETGRRVAIFIFED